MGVVKDRCEPLLVIYAGVKTAKAQKCMRLAIALEGNLAVCGEEIDELGIGKAINYA